MKISILLLLFCISVSIQNNSLEADFNKSDFVGLIEVKTQDSDFVEFKSIQVWKNSFMDVNYIKADDETLFEPNETYLVFTSLPIGRKNASILIINKESVVIKKQDIPKETLWFLTGQPCIDSSKKITKGCAERKRGSQICGCNGIEYWNECGASRDGVMKYKAGPCTD